MGHHVLDLFVGAPGAEGHVNGAAAQDCQVSDEPALAVFREDGDVRSGKDTEGDETCAQLLDHRIQLRVRKGLEAVIGLSSLQGGQGGILDDRLL